MERLRNPSSWASPSDLAWLAGLFEGEGYVSHNGTSKYPFIAMEQVDPEPLVKVQAICGGTTRTRTRVSGNKTRNILQWRLQGTRAREFARHIYPFLSTRRRAQLAPFFEDRRIYKKSDKRWGDQIGMVVLDA